jgi:UDP-N-acetyl-D-glucosamine dehydrogenase
MSPTFVKLLGALDTHQALIGIVGLGHVGLPLARGFAVKGFTVLGFDTDPARVAALQRRDQSIRDHSSLLTQHLPEKYFEVTSQLDRLGEPDVLLLCVPTPLTDSVEPDLTFVVEAARACTAMLRPGQLIVLESTTYPGTTRQVLQPVLAQTGLLAGQDFFLACSPERIDPGNAQYSVPDIPKIVGADDPASLELAVCLYRQLVQQVVRVSSTDIAETAKLLENTYRAVNIALVNEVKVVCDRLGIDVWEVIAAASTKPFGFQAFYPGPGLGGQCIPVAPVYLSWTARKHGMVSRLIELAGEVNAAMPQFVAEKVANALNERGKPIKESKIMVLGVAYKRDVDDARASPALDLMDLLQRRGATVSYNDPYVPRLPAIGRHAHLYRESQLLTADLLGVQDCVLIVTDHSGYDWKWIVSNATLVVDTRNATREVKEHRERIVRA